MRYRSWLAGIAVLSCCAAAGAVSAPRQLAGLFPEDTRLAQSVTVMRGRIYLGELLEQLSRETRVPLAVVQEQGPLDGIDLTVLVREQPLREVMAALPELLGHQFNRWAWRRAATPATGYVLYCQHSPAETAAAAQKAVYSRWAEDAREFYRIARLPGEVRARAAASRPDLFPGQMLKTGKPDLLASLAPQELEALLRGAEPAIDPGRLTPAAREGLKFGVRGLEGSQPRGQPRFFVTWEPHRVGPLLLAMNEQGVAGNVVGGQMWDAAWFRDHAEGWLHEEGPQVSAFRERVRQMGETGRSLPAGTTAEWIRRAAELQRFNVIADPVFRSGATFANPSLGGTPEETIMALVLRADLTAKKKGEIHLLRHKTTAIHPRLHLVPWKQVRAWREEAERTEGFLDFPELRELSDLSEEQSSAQSEEFPDIHGLRGWRSVLSFDAHLEKSARTRLRQPEGLPFTDTGLVARQHLVGGADPQSVRGLEHLEQHANQARLSLRLEKGKASFRKPRSRESMEQEVRRLIWEIQVPGQEDYRRELPLRARVPLKPE